MASWIKDPTNGYVQIAQIQRAYCGQSYDGVHWSIFAQCGQNMNYEVRTGYATLDAAQTALDAAIPNLGGSV